MSLAATDISWSLARTRVPAVPALKGKIRPLHAPETQHNFLSLGGQASLQQDQEHCSTAGKSAPCEATQLAPGKAAVTDQGNSRAAGKDLTDIRRMWHSTAMCWEEPAAHSPAGEIQHYSEEKLCLLLSVNCAPAPSQCQAAAMQSWRMSTQLLNDSVLLTR